MYHNVRKGHMLFYRVAFLQPKKIASVIYLVGHDPVKNHKNNKIKYVA